MEIILLALKRLGRIVSGKKGKYGVLGKGNHFAQGVLIYENAVIGSYNYFAPYAMVNNARIGNYCSIGPGCKIGLGEHDMTAISTMPAINNGAGNMELFNKEKPAVIGCDVWLGANVLVKQGVTIGSGAVIGANAVVTQDIPPYCVAVGIPAKVVRSRFSEEKCRALMDSEWFYKDKAQAKEIVAGLHKTWSKQQ